jgi:two-component sensor histidine kinase
VVDITERKRAQEILETQRNDLERTNREREVLLKEVYHRVKNNLQVISSLLNLQDEHISDPRSLALLQESKNRIHAIGLVHEQLYQTADLARIDFSIYIHELIDHLMSVFRPVLISVQVDVADVHLPLNVAVPVGLIINELVTNSLKHAFPNGASGRIVVRLWERRPGSVSLVVEDDGLGIPAHIEWGSGNSLGLELIAKLSKQLRGQVELDRTSGTKVHLVFDHAG